MRRKWKSAIVIVMGLASLPLLGWAYIYIAFSGGINSIIRNHRSPPDFNSASMIAARSKLAREFESAFQSVEKNIGATSYTQSTHDLCARGENNWKIQEEFAYRCTVQVTHFYGFDGDFEQRLLSFEKALTLDWAPFEYTLNRVVNEEFEYYVDNIRYPPSYRARGLSLHLHVGKGDEANISDLARFQTASSRLAPLHEEKSLQDTREIVTRIKRDHQYVLAIAINGNYFKN